MDMPKLIPQCLYLTAQTAGELPAGSILSFDKNLLINIAIQWFNVILLSAILVYFLYKPVKKFMANRTLRIRETIEDAQRSRDEAQELKEKYERMIADIENEREEILRQTHKKAMENSDQLLFDARREAELMYDHSLAQLELDRKNMTDEMKRQMIEISILMASRFVEVSIDRETQDRYIEEALADWEES